MFKHGGILNVFIKYNRRQIKLMKSKKLPISAPPNVIRLSRELGIDIKSVKSSNKNGRISIDDVKRHVKLLLSNAPLKNNDNSPHLLEKNDSKIKSMHTYHLDLVDEMYDKWLKSSDLVEPTWNYFFEGYQTGLSDNFVIHESSSIDNPDHIKQARFAGLIYSYRAIGHTIANFNPLVKEAPSNPRLILSRLGFSEVDLQSSYFTGNYLNGVELSLNTTIEKLEKTYCRTIGTEYLHIQETEKRKWIQERIEPTCFQPNFTVAEKLHVYKTIIEAETFEEFLQSKFLGQKRFGLEGGETLMAVLDAIFQRCGINSVDEIVMGMAHRGRLNVLANYLGKSLQYIIREFTDDYVPNTIYGSGDVKYHLGFESTRETLDKHSVDIVLAANPSHLESVDPVVQGKARARQRIRQDNHRTKVLPVLIHGDAAIAGQGMVAEVFNCSQLKGYRTGGTIHIVINNQIGFTTGPEDARSSVYCTDVAKIVEAPIFHVNCTDPLSVVAAVQTAFDYRQEFGSDVVIDMYCWRKHGHNESDEPAFTQPVLYNKISSLPKISETFGVELLKDTKIKNDQLDRIKKDYLARLNKAYEEVSLGDSKKNPYQESNAKIQSEYSFKPPKTAVSKNILHHVVKQHAIFPDGFRINKKVKKQLASKIDAFETDSGIDWGLAEILAFGSLLLEGTPVRISGQDSKRGTFSHRHAVLYDTETRERYTNLLDLGENQAQFCVHNSLLSEAAVLGFDYGYSLDFPEMLCIWEAQFGDFVNGAQVIIDQFITSSESKWGRPSGLVMLLPHGYEGQGPEHSSARIERFLQACAEDNIQVCNLTTPAQLFHAFRKQMKQAYRKPLIIMTPKSLLRHKLCISKVKDFTHGKFQQLIDDYNVHKKTVKKIIFCSGKIYYDLLEYRGACNFVDIAIVRVEQFYPLQSQSLKEIILSYPNATNITWCQEEPKNMGGWSFISDYFSDILQNPPNYVGRATASSPAVGSLSAHKKEQAEIVKNSMHIDEDLNKVKFKT